MMKKIAYIVLLFIAVGFFSLAYLSFGSYFADPYEMGNIYIESAYLYISAGAVVIFIIVIIVAAGIIGGKPAREGGTEKTENPATEEAEA